MSLQGPLNWVETGQFPVEPGEDADTNPEISGRAFARWVADHLQAAGEPVLEVLAEDFGRCVVLQRRPYLLWVGCANETGRTDRWGAFVCAEPHLWQRWRHSLDLRADVARVQARLLELLMSLTGAVEVEGAD